MWTICHSFLQQTPYVCPCLITGHRIRYCFQSFALTYIAYKHVLNTLFRIIYVIKTTGIFSLQALHVLNVSIFQVSSVFHFNLTKKNKFIFEKKYIKIMNMYIYSTQIYINAQIQIGYQRSQVTHRLASNTIYFYLYILHTFWQTGSALK